MAFIASCPFRWQAAPGLPCRRRTCPVHCRNSAPVLHGALCSSSLIREASPCTPRIYKSWVSGRKKIAPATSISSYIRYVPGPTCRGAVPLYMPPLAIKGEACNVTTQTQLRLSILKLPQQSNTQWSRVLRSGGPNHSKLLRVLMFIPTSRNKQNA